MKTNRMAPRRLALAIATATGSLLAGPVQEIWAVQTSWDVGIGAEYSDNVRRTAEHEQDELVLVPFVEAEVYEDSERLELAMDGRVEYRSYTRDRFDDDGLFNLNAAARFKIMPQFFDWVAEDYFRQAPIDVFLPVTPDNWQDANVFSTGPELYFRLTPTQRIELGGRWQSYYYGETDADNARLQGHVRWRSDYAPQRYVSANYEVTNVDYEEDQLYPDYVRHDLFARTDSRHGQVRLQADLGGTWLDRDVYEDVDGWLGHVRATWYMNERSELAVWYLDQLTDTSHNLLQYGQQNQPLGFVDQQVTGDLFNDQRLGVRFARLGEVNSFSLEAVHRSEEYEENIGVDREIDEFRADFERKIRPTLSGGLFGEYRELDYKNVDRNDKETAYGLRARYQARRDLRIDLLVQHDDRNSSVAGADFDENRVMLYARYGHFTPVAPARATRTRER